MASLTDQEFQQQIWAMYLNLKTICSKGQLILICLFGIVNSPKKRTKKFDFTKGQLISKASFLGLI